MKILSAFYGIPDKKIDVTDQCQIFCKENKMCISKDLNINNLFGDPAPGIQKKLTIKMENNGDLCEIELLEAHCKLIDGFDSTTYNFGSTKPPEIVHKVLMINHNFGGGTQKFVEDIIKLMTFPFINIIKAPVDSLRNGIPMCDFIHINSLMYIEPHGSCIDQNVANLIIQYKNNHKIPIILTVHDYQWLYPNNPTPEFTWADNNQPSIENVTVCEKIFSVCDKIVFPTNTVYLYHKQFISKEILNSERSVIADNPDLCQTQINHQFIPKLQENNTINIGILGDVPVHKGRNTIFSLAKYMTNINFIIIGTAMPEIDLPNVKTTGRYRNEDIFKLIAMHNVHILWYSGIAPETWSYTLTIGILTGLPLFYNNIGAFKERLNKIIYPHYYSYYKDNINTIGAKLNKLIEKIKSEQEKAIVYNENQWSGSYSKWYIKEYFRSYMKTYMKKQRFDILYNSLGGDAKIRSEQYIRSYMDIFSLHCQYYHDIRFKRKSDAVFRGIIIETRPKYKEILVGTLWNLIYYFGHKANITVITNKEIHIYLQKVFPDWNQVDYWMVNYDTLSDELYSELMMNIDLFKNMPEEFLLTIKTGSLILRSPEIKYSDGVYLNKAFIGAPRTEKNEYNDLKTPKNNSIDGRISIRKKSEIVKCLQSINYEGINNYRKINGMCPLQTLVEDVYYCTAMEYLGINLPNSEECADFAVSDNLRYGNGYPYFALCCYDDKYHLSDQEYLNILINLDYEITEDTKIKTEWKNLWKLANFDWQYYLKENPDLIKLGILTPYEAVLHFYNQGYEEKRAFCDYRSLAGKSPKYFDWNYYLEYNVDLLKDEITTQEAAINHYINSGHNERKIYCNFVNDITMFHNSQLKAIKDKQSHTIIEGK